MPNKNELVDNLIWKFLERITAQLVTLIVSIILARILDPSHYGSIAIVNIFITFANVFVSDGLGSALIQKKDADDLDFSSVLCFNIALSIILYIFLFLSAPYISSFFGKDYEILTPVLRVLSIRLIFSAVNSVQQAYIAKKMIFRKFFLATLIGTMTSAIVGIAMAYNGYGIWALVAQYLTNTIVDTMVLQLTLQLKISFNFSFDRIKKLYSFGLKILSTNLLITAFLELRSVIIGKVYSSAELAYFDQGKKFPNVIVTNINTSVGTVLFPKLSNEQDDIVKIKNTTRKSIKFSAFLMCPLMMGLAIVAEPFVKLILTEKWLPCVPLLQLFCIVYLFQPIHTANMQAIKAIGRSDVFLELEIFKKIIELVMLFITMNYGTQAIATGMAILTTLFTFVNAYPNIKLINYSFKEQMEDIIPTIIKTIVMVVVVYLFRNISNILVIQLFVQITVGIVTYLIISIATKSEELFYMLHIIKSYISKIVNLL